jgi:hypothetical protein
MNFTLKISRLDEGLLRREYNTILQKFQNILAKPEARQPLEKLVEMLIISRYFSAVVFTFSACKCREEEA